MFLLSNALYPDLMCTYEYPSLSSFHAYDISYILLHGHDVLVNVLCSLSSQVVFSANLQIR